MVIDDIQITLNNVLHSNLIEVQGFENTSVGSSRNTSIKRRRNKYTYNIKRSRQQVPIIKNKSRNKNKMEKKKKEKREKKNKQVQHKKPEVRVKLYRLTFSIGNFQVNISFGNQLLLLVSQLIGNLLVITMIQGETLYQNKLRCWYLRFNYPYSNLVLSKVQPWPLTMKSSVKFNIGKIIM